MLHPGRASLKRHVLVNIDSKEAHGTYLVEWPKECRVTIAQILNSMGKLATVSDICDCTACAYYQQCRPPRDRLWHIETEVDINE